MGHVLNFVLGFGPVGNVFIPLGHGPIDIVLWACVAVCGLADCDGVAVRWELKILR